MAKYTDQNKLSLVGKFPIELINVNTFMFD